MNTRNLLKASILAFLTLVLLVMLFCKPKSKSPFEPYVPDEQDPQTIMIGRPSGEDDAHI